MHIKTSIVEVTEIAQRCWNNEYMCLIKQKLRRMEK